MSVTVTLCYKGQEYTFVDDFDYQPWLHADGTIARTAFESAEYMYTEGNYACDCNRSTFLAQHCGVDFREDQGAIGDDDEEWSLDCGNEIELVSLDNVKYVNNESVTECVEWKQAPSGLYLKTRING